MRAQYCAPALRTDALEVQQTIATRASTTPKWPSLGRSTPTLAQPCWCDHIGRCGWGLERASGRSEMQDHLARLCGRARACRLAPLQVPIQLPLRVDQCGLAERRRRDRLPLLSGLCGSSRANLPPSCGLRCCLDPCGCFDRDGPEPVLHLCCAAIIPILYCHCDVLLLRWCKVSMLVQHWCNLHYVVLKCSQQV